jgi:hypothetical protein
VDLSYLLAPFIAWLVAGTLKFLVNSVKSGHLAFGLIGYGGFPSNHSAIVSSAAALIAFKEGLAHPAFGVGLTLAFIVILDASSLRRQVGKQAVMINRLADQEHFHSPLRERIGHTPFEIIGGVGVGIAVAAVLNSVFR